MCLFLFQQPRLFLTSVHALPRDLLAALFPTSPSPTYISHPDGGMHRRSHGNRSGERLDFVAAASRRNAGQDVGRKFHSRCEKHSQRWLQMWAECTEDMEDGPSPRPRSHTHAHLLGVPHPNVRWLLPGAGGRCSRRRAIRRIVSNQPPPLFDKFQLGFNFFGDKKTNR